MMKIFRKETYKVTKFYVLVIVHNFQTKHFKFIVGDQIILNGFSHDIYCPKSNFQRPRDDPFNQDSHNFLTLFLNLIA